MDLTALFYERFQTPPTVEARAPGRVNLLGEHVDYNEGIVLPAAIDRNVQILAAPLDEPIVHLAAPNLDTSVSFRLEDFSRKLDINGNPLPAWALYPAGVAWALHSAGYPLSGMQAIYSSDVPIGAGLSSSAAVEVGFAVVWQQLGGWQASAMDLARLCQKAENLFVGVSSGLMDQFASAHGVEGHALAFDTRSLEWQPFPLPEDTALVIADSGVRRTLTTSAYNERRASCEEAVALLQQYLPGIHSLRDVSPAEFAAYAPTLPEVTRKRAEHIVKEIHRVEAAMTALKAGERKAFGAFLYACHASLRDLYEVSTPELDTLVQIARKLPGCFGARLTGAGFGGCTVNLVEQEQAGAFIEGLSRQYLAESGREAQVYLCHASRGAYAQNIS